MSARGLGRIRLLPAITFYEVAGFTCFPVAKTEELALLYKGQQPTWTDVYEWIEKNCKSLGDSKTQVNAARLLGRPFCKHCKVYGHSIAKCWYKNNNQKSDDKGRPPAEQTGAYNISSSTPNDLTAYNAVDEMMVDSGATESVFCNRSLFNDLRPANVDIQGFHGAHQRCTEIGLARVPHTDIVVEKVRYMPSAKCNFLSVPQLTEMGITVKFDNDHVYFDGRPVGSYRKRAYYMDNLSGTRVLAIDTVVNALLPVDSMVKLPKNVPARLWHQRLGHPSDLSIRKLADLGDEFLNYRGCSKTCKICAQSKIRAEIPKVATRSTNHPLEVTVADVCGPLPQQTSEGHRFFLVIVDVHTRYVTTYPLRQKSEVRGKVIEYLKHLQNMWQERSGLAQGYKPTIFRSDNGSEFMNEGLQEYFEDQGIHHEKTVAGELHQNGIAERTIGVLNMIQRCLRTDGMVPVELWHYMLAHATLLMNVRANRLGESATPYCRWRGRQYEYGRLRVFGCYMAAHVPLSRRDNKFANPGTAGVHLGRDPDSDAYLMLQLHDGRVALVGTGKFIETDFPFSTGTISIATSKRLRAPQSAPLEGGGGGGGTYQAPAPAPDTTTEDPDDEMAGGETEAVDQDGDVDLTIQSDDNDGYHTPTEEPSAVVTAAVPQPVEPMVEDTPPPRRPDSHELVPSLPIGLPGSQPQIETIDSSLPRYPDGHELVPHLPQALPLSPRRIMPPPDTDAISDATAIAAVDQLDNRRRAVTTGPEETALRTTTNRGRRRPVILIESGSDSFGYTTDDSTLLNLDAHSPTLDGEDDLVWRPDENSGLRTLFTVLAQPGAGREPNTRLRGALWAPQNHGDAWTRHEVTNQDTLAGAYQFVRGHPTSRFDFNRGPEPNSKRTVPIVEEPQTPRPLANALQPPIPFTDISADSSDVNMMVSLKSGELSPVDTTVTVINELLSADAKMLVALPTVRDISLRDARRRPDWPLFEKAIKSEFGSLALQRVMSPAPHYTGGSVGSRLVLTIKTDGTYKARLVAQGFSQREGIDYDEIFSSVIRYDSVKLLIQLAASRNWDIDQMDVKTAFLNAPLDKEIYMRAPKGIDWPSPVYKLHKSLYGLKQAPLKWGEMLADTLQSLNFERNKAEECIFYRKSKTGGEVIVGVYVDDLLITGLSRKAIDKVKTQLLAKFDMKDLGLLSMFLRMGIKQTKTHITILHLEYIELIAKEENIKDFKPTKYPMPLDGGKPIESPLMADPKKFRSLVGKLLFTANNVRFDVLYPVGILSRKMQNPTERDYELAKRVLLYLITFKDVELRYKKGEKLSLVGYADADFATCPETRRSTGGYIFLGKGNSPVTWCLRRQSSPASSTCEAEYVALYDAVQEASWLKQVLEGLGEKVSSIPVYEDNEAALTLAKHPANHKRTKHIDVKYHIIRDKMLKGVVNIEPIRTHEQMADGLTKAVVGEKFHRFRDGNIAGGHELLHLNVNVMSSEASHHSGGVLRVCIEIKDAHEE